MWIGIKLSENKPFFKLSIFRVISEPNEAYLVKKKKKNIVFDYATKNNEHIEIRMRK